MAPTITDNSALLVRLATLTDASAAAAVVRESMPVGVDVDAWVRALAEDADRLVMRDLAAAIAGSLALVWAADAVAGAATRARVRRSHAQALAYSNRSDEALAVLGDAIQLAEAGNDRVEAARAWMTSIHALARQGRYDEAIRAGSDARQTLMDAGETMLAAQADVNTGVVHRMRGDAAGAIALFERALPALGSNPTFVARVESNRAEALLDVGRFGDAEASFRAAGDAFTLAGLGRAAGIVEGNLADLCGRQGRLDAALEHFELARRVLGESDAPGDVARLEAEQAETLSLMGMLEDAAALYRGAIPRLREHKLPWEAARAETGLGRTLLRMGHAAEAATALEAASAAFAALGHEVGSARVRLLLAAAARDRGELEVAAGLAREALAQSGDRPADAAAARTLLAEIGLKRGQADESGHAAAAVALARPLGIAPLLADALRVSGLVRSAAGDLDGAGLLLSEAMDQVERVRGTLQADRFRAAFAGDRTAVYEDAARVALDSGGVGGVGAAFAIVERSKSRSLLDLLHGGVRLAGVGAGAGEGDAAERAMLEALATDRAALNAAYARAGESGQRPGAMGVSPNWAQETSTLEMRIRTLERRLASTRRFAGVFAEAAGAELICPLLGAGTGLIEYFVTGRRLHAFVLSREGVTVREGIADFAEVREHLDALYFQIGRAMARGMPTGRAGERLAVDAQQALDRLRGAVLEPLEEAISGMTMLHVVPHGQLQAAPFQAMAPDRLIGVVPSASVLRLIRQRPAAGGEGGGAGGGAPLVIGFSDELAPRIDREVAEVAAQLEGAEVIQGRDATVERVHRAMEGRGLIHIACHARFMPQDPLASGFRMADGWLTARELYRSSLACASVVMSACDTGRAVVRGGDEAWGFLRAFLAAGASRLIMSLWPLHDESARGMMATAYRSLRESGSDPHAFATAFREASGSIRSHQPHAAAWAPLTLVGDV